MAKPQVSTYSGINELPFGIGNSIDEKYFSLLDSIEQGLNETFEDYGLSIDADDKYMSMKNRSFERAESPEEVAALLDSGYHREETELHWEFEQGDGVVRINYRPHDGNLMRVDVVNDDVKGVERIEDVYSTLDDILSTNMFN